MTALPETRDAGLGVAQWFGEHLGCSGFLDPDGSGSLTVGGHAGITTMRDVREIDAFVCALGRLLGWRMPRAQVRSPLRLRRAHGAVTVRHEAVSRECGRPVADVLAAAEAEHLFVWLCEHFGWEDAGSG